jgi:ligand-binding SRPBCC domain-containing protein
MADYILERRVWLRRPRAQVFEFFADPRNLEQLHPAWARPRWLTPPPARLAAGVVLDFRAAWLPGRWRVIVREFDAPYRFVDAQVNGPFARWEHRHRFTDGAEGEGGTWVEDRVTYRLPLGPLGRLAHGLGVGARVRALFEYRDHSLRELFGGGPDKT